MAKDKPKRKAEVRVPFGDLEDIIRDQIYGGAVKIDGEPLTISMVGNSTVICIPIEDVKKIAAKIAKHAWIGH